jgi:hypothetical protein
VIHPNGGVAVYYTEKIVESDHENLGLLTPFQNPGDTPEVSYMLQLNQFTYMVDG